MSVYKDYEQLPSNAKLFPKVCSIKKVNWKFGNCLLKCLFLSVYFALIGASFEQHTKTKRLTLAVPGLTSKIYLVELYILVDRNSRPVKICDWIIHVTLDLQLEI